MNQRQLGINKMYATCRDAGDDAMNATARLDAYGHTIDAPVTDDELRDARAAYGDPLDGYEPDAEQPPSMGNLAVRIAHEMYRRIRNGDDNPAANAQDGFHVI